MKATTFIPFVGVGARIRCGGRGISHRAYLTAQVRAGPQICGVRCELPDCQEPRVSCCDPGQHRCVTAVPRPCSRHVCDNAQFPERPGLMARRKLDLVTARLPLP